MLQKIVGVVMRPPVPMAIGVVLAVVLVWFGGHFLLPIYGWPSHALIVVLCVAIVVAAVAFVVLRSIRARRKARAIENEIRAQGKVQAQTLPPSGQGEVAALQQRFDEALESLKQSRLGRGALYAMPWYVIIGPPGSGKTTAITESGLNFPFLKGPNQKRGIRGLGGTRNCDWWFTDQSILLDTAGRYTTQVEDHDEWLAFLGMIKKARKLKPINGVMVAISIADVLGASEERLEQHATTIRQRIDELVKQLEVVFPIYLVFTKCDLLDGFVEFFGSLSKEERAQVWGATLELATAQDQPMHESFAAEFELLCQRIGQERLRLLVPDRPAVQQQKIFSLSLQLRAAQRKLTEFVRLLTQPNPYSDASELRGFYLTSGTQEGAPIDLVLQKLSAAFGLQPQADAAQPGTVDAKSYFIRDLFTKVMYADRELAHSSAGRQRRRELVRRGVIFGSIAAVLILGATSVWTFNASCNLLHAAEQAVQEAKANPIHAERDGLPDAKAWAALDDLRGRYLALDDAYSATSLLGPSATVVQAALDHYASCIRETFLRPCNKYLLKQLEEFVKSEPDKSSLQKYSQLLLVYRSTDKDYQDPRLLGKAIEQQNLWKASPAEFGQSAEIDPISAASRHLAAYLAARQRSDGWVVGYFPDLVGRVEQKLEANGQVESMLSRRFETDDTLRRATNAEIEREALRMREQTPGASQIPEEKWKQDALRTRKDAEMRRVGNIGLLRTDSLNAIADSLTDLAKDESPHRVKFNESLTNLRAAQVLEPAVPGRDPIEDAFVNSLKIIAEMRAPVQDLFESGPLGQRIRQDLGTGSKRLGALGQKLAETRTKVSQKLEAVQKLSGLATEPIRKSLFGMVDAVAEGVAREVRAEIQESWTRLAGAELAAMRDKFPCNKDATEEIGKSDFIEMFRPEGKLARALQLLDQAHGLPQLENRLVWSDRFDDLRERLATLQRAGFDAAAPKVARLQFRIGRMEQLSTNGLSPVQEVILRMNTGNEVKMNDKSDALRINDLCSWNIGDPGGRIILELTLRDGDHNLRCAIPDEKDTKAATSEWGFIRVVRAATLAEQQDVLLTWRIPYRRANDPQPYEASAAVVLKPEGKDNPFALGFFELRPPENVFQADVKQ